MDQRQLGCAVGVHQHRHIVGMAVLRAPAAFGLSPPTQGAGAGESGLGLPDRFRLSGQQHEPGGDLHPVHRIDAAYRAGQLQQFDHGSGADRRIARHGPAQPHHAPGAAGVRELHEPGHVSIAGSSGRPPLRAERRRRASHRHAPTAFRHCHGHQRLRPRTRRIGSQRNFLIQGEDNELMRPATTTTERLKHKHANRELERWIESLV